MKKQDWLQDVAREIKNFLNENGAHPGGYKTYFKGEFTKGVVTAPSWNTVKAYETMSSREMIRKASALAWKIQDMIPQEEDGRVVVTTKVDQEQGTVYINYIQETGKMLIM